MISVQTLKFYPLFSSLSPEVLEKISKISHIVYLEPGDVLFEEGQTAEYLYVVDSGSISLNLKVPNREGVEFVQEMDPMKKGEMVGWSAVVGPGDYKFGVVANTAAMLIRVNGAGLKKIMNEHIEDGYQLLYKIADVIRERLEMKCMQLLSMVEV
ncbi:MAG: cyclic nucleotide-binding domain-containing protein [Anaerolineales bacterium]|nr:cyclic nucleotide-binding domain-containing protein [Anaerolineales bacterium]